MHHRTLGRECCQEPVFFLCPTPDVKRSSTARPGVSMHRTANLPSEEVRISIAAPPPPRRPGSSLPGRCIQLRVGGKRGFPGIFLVWKRTWCPGPGWRSWTQMGHRERRQGVGVADNGNAMPAPTLLKVSAIFRMNSEGYGLGGGAKKREVSQSPPLKKQQNLDSQCESNDPNPHWLELNSLQSANFLPG